MRLDGGNGGELSLGVEKGGRWCAFVSGEWRRHVRPAFSVRYGSEHLAACCSGVVCRAAATFMRSILHCILSSYVYFVCQHLWICFVWVAKVSVQRPLRYVEGSLGSVGVLVFLVYENLMFGPYFRFATRGST